MKRNGKNYLIDNKDDFDHSFSDDSCPWIWQLANHKINFSRWKHKFGDPTKPEIDRGEILDQFRHALWGLRHELVVASILGLYKNAVVIMMLFIDETSTTIKSIDDITGIVMNSLVSWLKNSKHHHNEKIISYITARTRYEAIKSVLYFYAKRGLFNAQMFPVNPFPNSNRAGKGTEPYNKIEIQKIMRALYSELRAIKDGTSKLTLRVQMAVYQLIIYANTGINKTPLEEASRKSVTPHPLKPESASVMVVYKRRGMNTQSVKLNNCVEIKEVKDIPNNVAEIIKHVVSITEDLVQEAPTKFKDRIWLYRSKIGKSVQVLEGQNMNQCARTISEHYNLNDSQGNFLSISPKRLRKTFALRIWELTGGDIWKTSKLLGNTPRIADRHYLTVTPEMEKNHRFVGMAMEMNIRSNQNDPKAIENFAKAVKISVEKAKIVLSGKNNTLVSKCSDPIMGKYAQKDGSPCTRFLNCFRCPNQIVLKDDLYRLYSFYWRVLKERTYLGKKRWKSLYGWVIREIDNEISKKFKSLDIEYAKQKARINPHPLWRQNNILGHKHD